MLPALIEPLPEIRVGPGVWVDLGRVPADPECMAALCTGEAVAHALWLSSDWTRLEWPLVCSAHATALTGRCVIVPLGMLPPEPVLVRAVQAEVDRRRAAPYHQAVFQFVQTASATMGFQFNNPTAGFNIQWG